MIPIIILNYFAGITGGIWLIFKGQIAIVILGLGASFLMPFIYGILVGIPTLLLTPIITWLQEKNQKTLTLIMVSLVFFVNALINLIWVFAVLAYAISFSESSTLIPFIIFGYTIATSPFMYMAKGELPDNYATNFHVFIIQISYILMALFYLLDVAFLTIPTILIIIISFSIYIAKISSYLYTDNHYE